MNDFEEFNVTPELTLDPSQEEKKETPQIYQETEPETPEIVLTPEEKNMVSAFAEKIDLANSNMILQYGAGTQKKIADFSEKALENVKTKDLGEVGTLLSDVVTELKGFDEEEEKLIWSNCGECEEIDWNMLFDTDKKYYVGIVKFKEEE